MDTDLNDLAWGELGELFSKDSSTSSGIDAFQVQLNGDLVVPVADLPLPNVTIPQHATRLDASLNPVAERTEGDSVASPTSMDIDCKSKDEELLTVATSLLKSEPEPAIVKTEAELESTTLYPSSNTVPSTLSTAQTPASVTPKPKPTTPPSAAFAVVAQTADGRVEKRPIGSLKEKREREAKQFPRNLLANLDGTTSAEVRKMSSKERELVLYKRKLRNRESARRSRQKRQATLAELQEEIGDLLLVAGRVVDAGLALREENGSLRAKLDLAQAEIRALRAVYTDATPNESNTGPSASTKGTEMPNALVASKATEAKAKSGVEEDIPLKMKMGG